MGLNTPDGTRVLLGRGKGYFDRFTAAGVATGERYLGNLVNVEMSGSVETRDLYSTHDPSGTLLARATIRSTQELTVGFNEIDDENAALHALGVADSVVVTSGSVSNEAIGASGIVMDRWYQLANRKISAVVIQKTATSLTIDTDYKIDTTWGRVLFITGGPGGVVAGATDLNADYTKDAATYSRVKLGTAGQIVGKFTFISENLVGLNWELECWRVQVAPDGPLGLMGDDYAAPRLRMALLRDDTNHPNEPYGTLIRRAA